MFVLSGAQHCRRGLEKFRAAPLETRDLFVPQIPRKYHSKVSLTLSLDRQDLVRSVLQRNLMAPEQDIHPLFVRPTDTGPQDLDIEAPGAGQVRNGDRQVKNV